MRNRLSFRSIAMTVAEWVVLVISLAFSTVPQSASAQDGVAPTLLRKRFGAAEGSPAVTNKITQTRDGFLWFVGGGMQYRLEGVDSEWLDAGDEPKAIYNRLSPGRHTLRIRASNRSGIWDREGVVLTVTQEPFFYQTGWFAAVVVASALLVIAAAYRQRR